MACAQEILWGEVISGNGRYGEKGKKEQGRRERPHIGRLPIAKMMGMMPASLGQEVSSTRLKSPRLTCHRFTAAERWT